MVIVHTKENNMNRRPSLQFYPADWIKDPDLQMCSMNTIGVWINIMCRMWEVKEEGILQGKVSELALLVGAKPGEFRRFLKEAEEHKFCDVLHDVTDNYNYVTIKCRRMNKLFLEHEGAKRRMQKHRGKQCNDDVAPHSSTSSSSSTTNKEYMSIFDESRKLFKGTKRGLQTEYDNFVKKHADWKEVLSLLAPAVSQQIIWRAEDGCYWKHLQTWINNRCWEETKGASQTESKGKTKLFPISGKVCSKPGCRMPAVYKDTSGAYDNYLCKVHLPDKVKIEYE